MQDKDRARTKVISAAAFFDRLVLHPLDTVITLKQNSEKLTSVPAIIKKLYGASGCIGFYRGFYPAMCMSVPARLTMLGSYVYLNDFYSKFLTNSAAVKIYSGLTSGVIEAMLMTPVEVCRVKKVFSQSINYGNLYCGFSPNLYRLMVGNTFIMSGTEIVSERLNIKKQSALSFFSVGFFLGASAQIVTTPLDVLKTRVIVSDGKNSLINHTKEIIASKSYFNSLFLRMMRQGFGSGIMMIFLSLLKTENLTSDALNQEVRAKPRL